VGNRSGKKQQASKTARVGNSDTQPAGWVFRFFLSRFSSTLKSSLQKTSQEICTEEN
jgi:hypothetical protein